MSIRTSVFLQVEPEFSHYDTGRPISAKVVRITQRNPMHNQLGGTVLVKITLDIPETAFKPLTPEAVVVVPEGLTTAVPIVVEAAEPT